MTSHHATSCAKPSSHNFLCHYLEINADFSFFDVIVVHLFNSELVKCSRDYGIKANNFMHCFSLARISSIFFKSIMSLLNLSKWALMDVPLVN